MMLTLQEGSLTIHLVKEVKCDRATRRSVVKCGLTIMDDSNTRPAEWTVWHSRITCQECL